MGFHEISWNFMRFHVISWIFMDLHGFSWIFMDFHGSSWIFMDLHGSPWIFMRFHVFSWDLMRCSVNHFDIYCFKRLFPHVCIVNPFFVFYNGLSSPEFVFLQFLAYLTKFFRPDSAQNLEKLLRLSGLSSPVWGLKSNWTTLRLMKAWSDFQIQWGFPAKVLK
jgi:hypothetical protein